MRKKELNRELNIKYIQKTKKIIAYLFFINSYFFFFKKVIRKIMLITDTDIFVRKGPNIKKSGVKISK